MNHNVQVALWWTVLENVSGSVRSGDALSALIYLLTKRNAVVGYVQGLNGVMQLVAAIPAGVLADRARRDVILRFGAVVGVAGGVGLSWAVSFTSSAWALAAAMALLGVYKGCYGPSLEALFADSIETGHSSVLTLRYVLMILASGAGPLLSLLIFLKLGDAWNVGDCRLVVLVGVALMAPALALMCVFNDDKTLGALSEAAPHAAGASLARQASSSAALNGKDSEAAALHYGCFACCGACSPGVAVTLLVTGSDFIGALASGMTLKFFSLFFMQRIGFSPVAVSLLSCLTPLGVSAAALAAQRASKWVGRVQLSLLTRAVDILLLVAMARLSTTPGVARQLLVAAHLVRMACANCTRPLLRSVLNQFVPKRHRGKVSAADSVRTFSWSGSAALGGILVERYGFERTFEITAAVKLLAFVPLIFLVKWVPDGVFAGGAGRAAAAAGYSLLPEREAENGHAIEAAESRADAAEEVGALESSPG